MKILITGGNGFIGSHLIEQLLAQHHQIVCFKRKTSNLHWIENLPAELVNGDISDFGSLINNISGFDVVYHLGGILRAKIVEDYFKINVEGTRNLLEACRLRNPGLKRFVYISSQAAAGPGRDGSPRTEDTPPNPVSNYGKSKLEAEQVVSGYSKYFPVTIIRPPAVYGPRDDDILQFFKYVKLGIKPVIGNPNKNVAVIYIYDLIRGILLATEHSEAENELFFMADRNAYTWKDVYDTISRVMNKKAIMISMPIPIVSAMAAINETITRLFNRAAMFNQDKTNEMKQRHWLVDCSKAEQKLGFTPQTTLEQGFKETYEWYRSQGWL
ncbi:MAG: NAD(P)-dependent oxidoreductase [bacterium]|nr:NAD(P)-dependent oxidoreductase [bacterium]